MVQNGFVLWCLLVVSGLLARHSGVFANQLTVLVQPVTSVAGEALALQPVVALTDDNGNILTDVSVGSVHATIGINPPIFATLTPSSNTFNFVNGIATCSQLSINLVGSGFTIVLTSTYHGVRTETSSFDVVVGAKYKLSILSDVSTAFGGEPFNPQPSVGVVDKGGNLVTTLSSGTVRLEIVKNPSGGHLLPAGSLNVSIGEGFAKFQDLYIDISGSPYVLRYTTDLVLDGGSYIETNPFTVAAGACHALIMTNTLIDATGGRAFPVQPVVKLVDAGGNLLQDDSTSRVRVEIASNPSGGVISPDYALRADVQQGVANFRSLRIDKAGNDYSLVFKLYTKTYGKNVWTLTSIQRISMSFNVVVGRPTKLFMRQDLSDGVLDGQPIERQPLLNLLDFGGNIVANSSGSVTASLIPSASTLSAIVIDTSNAPMTTIVSVTALATALPSPFGVGMDIRIQVTFSDDVLVSGGPTLELSVGTGGKTSLAQCSTDYTWSKTVVFDYIVATNDVSSDLEYVSTSSLQLNGGTITNRNGNAASLTLPAVGSAKSLAGTSAVVVDTSAPTIKMVSCTTPGDGEYGSGEQIFIKVQFTASVTVYGIPMLQLGLTAIGGGALARQASFASGNNSDTLVFLYVVQDGDASADLDVTTSINLNGGSIKRTSTRPTTDVITTMPTAPNNLASRNAIVIDTSIPTVDSSIGVTSTSSNGIYAPGDDISIMVTFTKPVLVQGFPRLYLETGSVKRPAWYSSGSGTKKLTFVYTVVASDTHSMTGNTALNYRDDSALDLNGGVIRRLILQGTTSASADVSLTLTTLNGKSLKNNAQLQIDGNPPTVTSLQIVNPAASVTRGNSVSISISFSSLVTVDTANGVPTLKLALGNNRKAVYQSGSGTLQLLFTYVVRLADNTANVGGLDYASTSALELNGATIRRSSKVPTLDASIVLPAPTLSMAIPPVQVNPSAAITTTVVSVTADKTAGQYGSNEVITITITFSDEVGVTGSPKIALNTNQIVSYISGSATTQLIFMYIVADGDSTTSLNKLHDNALTCTNDCTSVTNFNNVPVSLSLAGIDLSPSNIAIDTSAPVVVAVYSPTPTSPYNDGTFVIGDQIDIIVEMSTEVFIDPPPSANPDKAPLLFLNSQTAGRPVLCVGFSNDNRKLLLFEYIVQAGDMTDNLAVLNLNSLTLNNDQCTIKRFSTTPKTNAVLTLPNTLPLGTKFAQTLKIDTVTIPKVLSIYSTTANGTYRCGDKIAISISFSKHVVVTGVPELWMNLGEDDQRAYYVSGTGTKILNFVYTVAENDYSVDLDYIDPHSLEAAVDALIQQRSTNPKTLANLDLPPPGTQNSLGSNRDLVIDGRKPFINAATFLTADGTYARADKIVLQLTFSACVVVDTTNGTPSVKIRPGQADRFAIYKSGSGSTKLLFEYSVETGDTADDLDYAEAGSLLLNGGKILTCLSTSTPSQMVDGHLNPPGGRLLGALTKPITFGVVRFNDLSIDRLGYGYNVIFSCQLGTVFLQTVSTINVLYSSAFELRSSPYTANDRLGSSVDVDQDTLVLGAPGAKHEISAVQIVTVAGTSDSFVDEIQSITTSAMQRPAIQELTSSAAPGEKIGGFFYLKYGTIGPSRRIYYDFDETQLRIALEMDLGFDGETIQVSRTENYYCSCDNGFVWSITFLTIEGPLSALSTVSYLTGRLASVGDGRGGNAAVIKVDSTVIGGFFTLRSGVAVTRNIKFNVAEDELAQIVNQDLGLAVRRVMRTGPSTKREYKWAVTFAASDTMYDVPDLVPQSAGLTGYLAQAKVVTDRQGLGRVSGFFRLRFRQTLFNEETDNIAVTASDRDMESALEKLVAINDVSVIRSTMNPFGGYSWTITFIQINTKNEYGAVVDTSGNTSPLIPVTQIGLTPILLGSGARVDVMYGGYSLPPVTGTHVGVPGDNAGMAVVFIRTKVGWRQQPTGVLYGKDTRNDDLFGASVAISGDFAVVGAPAASIYGDYELQNFLCDADFGTFTFIYRGQVSSPVPFNADKAMLQTAIASIMSVSFGDVDLSTFGRLCSNVEITITLRASDHADPSGDIPQLDVDPTNLRKGANAGSAVISEYRRGTFRRDGLGAKGLQCGAAYIFQRDVNGVWSQHTKLYPTDDLIDMQGFGTSVSIEGSTIVVGVPGAFSNQGRALVYHYNAGINTWTLFQTLSATPYKVTNGDLFGTSVSVSGLTIAVGAPGHTLNTGSVFIFELVRGFFQNRQWIQPSELRGNDGFGNAVSLDMTKFTLVAGAMKTTQNNQQSGACFVFVRRSATDTFFVLQQMLLGSDARPGDNFGTSVSVSGDTVVVGAHEDYTGPFSIRKPVQAITSTAATTITGGTFLISYKQLQVMGVQKQLARKTTRPIPFNIDQNSMEVLLESDLDLGSVVVTRVGPDPTNGYTWSITFIDVTSDLPLMETDATGLLGGTSMQVVAQWVVPVVPVLRGNAYVFTRSASGRWTEQATLYPRAKQYYSWFGSAVAVNQRTAVIGAPNLDTFESSINSGGGYVYDMGFLALKFSASTYSVQEGTDKDIQVQRCSLNGGFCSVDIRASPAQYINYDTGDAFSDLQGSNYVEVIPKVGPYRELSQLDTIATDPNGFFAPDVMGQEPFPQIGAGRWLNALQVGTANGRNQFYGSTDRRSLWVDSTFDYAGVSDYATSRGELHFDPDVDSLTFSVSTTADHVVESPDETVMLRLSLPGVWPSFGGNLWATLTINDDGDGASGTRSYLDVLTASTPQFHSGFGSTVDVFDGGNLAIVGTPLETQTILNQQIQCGSAHIYQRISGVWELAAKIVSDDCVDGMQFGASVSIDGYLGTTRALIGAPGTFCAYIFVLTGTTWTMEKKISEVDATSINHHYADIKGVAISGDIAAVAAWGLESVFVYHRVLAGWQFQTRLRAGDRIVFPLLEQRLEQRYEFGTSIALHHRTIVVGAPFCDAHVFPPPQYHNAGLDRRFSVPGAAYVYSIQAQEQQIQLRNDEPLSAGTFMLTLTYRGVTSVTKEISYVASAADLKTALEDQLLNVKLVEVTRAGSIADGFAWTVTFVGEVLSVPLLQPLWNGYGCTSCTPFNTGYKVNPPNQVLVTEVTPIGTWQQQARLDPPDANNADRFGHSVDVSGEQAIVGAYGSSALTTTTWDFETGDLTGWLSTGTAFDSQPTFGDNSYARINVYRFHPYDTESAGQRAHHEGRYWVGTFENRPGAGRKTVIDATCSFANDQCRATNYKLPGANAAGTYQGDGAVGTLTSQAFVVLGDRITFRLGGGCDINVIYVELLVDGISKRKATGRCEETMRQVEWTVGEFFNQTAQMRLVDASTSDYWGHINFDDVRFNWDVHQQATPKAGVAYTFRRKALGTLEPCVRINRVLCDWEFQARLIASDKRLDDRFGVAVAVDDTTGLAVVGASGARAANANNSVLLKPKDGKSIDQVGAMYLFKRQDEQRDGKGNLVTPPRWNPKETAKLQPPLKNAAGMFGSALALDQYTLISGAPGWTVSPLLSQVGQAFVYDTGFQYVSFTSNLFYGVENRDDGMVSLTITRDGNLNNPLTVGYATEDLSALSIDSLKYADCMKLPVTLRNGCRDYQQTAGEVTFAIKETSKQIMIPLVDDICYEAHEEYFVVRLSVPGGEPLLGEQYITKVRIDDDDFGNDAC